MENKTTACTKHAQKRIKERTVKSDRMLDLALSRGVDSTSFRGSFRRYLDRITFNTKFYGTIIVYNNCIYLFKENKEEKVLITVMNVPSKYQKYDKRGGQL